MQLVSSRRKAPPAIDFPYNSAAKVWSLSDLEVNQLVVTSSVHGHFPAILPADATDKRLSQGRLMITKHAAGPEQYCVVLPWRKVTGIDTSKRKVGDPIFLGKKGNFAFSPPKNAAFVRQVGTVLTADTAGTIILDVTSESNHYDSMSAAHVQPAQSSTVGALPVMFRFDVDASGKANQINLDFPVNVIDVWAVKSGATSKTGTVTVANGKGDLFSPLCFTGVDVGDIVRVSKLPTDGRRSIAGGRLSVITSGKNTACQIYILAEREG
jgi:hypothetical protein|tara:strand:- start:2044 stop:2847 length:804 start_codon:yes stop_codon:yes gene_type:complete